MSRSTAYVATSTERTTGGHDREDPATKKWKLDTISSKTHARQVNLTRRVSQLLGATTRHIEPDALVTQGIVCDDLAALIERLAAHEPGFRLAG